MRAGVQQQIGHIEKPVVSKCLIQRFLGQRHGLRLAFDEHERCHLTVIDDCVCAEVLAVGHSERRFDGNKGGRITQLLHQTVKQLLANPLFGGQTHPAVTPLAENLLLIIIHARAQGANGLLRYGLSVRFRFSRCRLLGSHAG